jgi:S1-C subfamily serine protease
MSNTPGQTEFIAPPQNAAEPSSQHSRQKDGLQTGAIIGLMISLVAVFVIGGFAGWVFTQTKSSPSGTSTLTWQEAAAAKVKPSVVEVYVTEQQGAALGSGVIIDPRGYLVTNNHVVSGATSIQVVLSNGTREPAQLIGTDPADDLAVLKIAVPSAGLSIATLGNSAQLQVGQEVLAIGNPLGDTETVTTGIVSALKRSVSEGQGGATIQNAIQTDAAINPGNSGGALIDMQGNVVGIPTLMAIDPEFKTPANGVGFAIPSNRVKSVVQQIIQTGTSPSA